MSRGDEKSRGPLAAESASAFDPRGPLSRSGRARTVRSCDIGFLSHMIKISPQDLPQYLRPLLRRQGALSLKGIEPRRGPEPIFRNFGGVGVRVTRAPQSQYVFIPVSKQGAQRSTAFGLVRRDHICLLFADAARQ